MQEHQLVEYPTEAERKLPHNLKAGGENGGAKMKHYYKSSGLQMFLTGAAIAVMFIVILCADSLIEFIL